MQRKPMARKTIIYIAGYGRSGSTLLARLLGDHEAIFTAGELINFIDLVDSCDVDCSCGRELCTCPFWSKVFEAFTAGSPNGQEIAKNQKKMESIAGFPGSVCGFTSSRVDRYCRISRNVMDSIFKRSPDHTRFIVDSSKTTWSRCNRPLMLSRMGDYDVKVIHLVRDGRGCLWSMIRGTDTGLLKKAKLLERSSFPVFRTALHWPLANLAAHLFQLLRPPANYCRIRYEDLVENPEQVSETLEKFLGITSLSTFGAMKTGAEIRLQHIMAGNRMRASKKVTVRADLEWKERLPKGQALLFGVLNWPLMRLYGYGCNHKGRT
jgi:hypothetical protein